MSCGHVENDAAYVLGALSPAERAEFQQHLNECADCSRRVQALAGLPGLLARVPADVLETAPADEPLPATLLSTLVAEVRRSQRRRSFRAAGLAAAAAVVVAAGAVAADHAVEDRPDAPPAVTTAPARQMQAVGGDDLAAEVALTSVPWGTRLDLTCSYATDEGHGEHYGARTYAMVVRTRDGRIEHVATWRALPGKTMRLTAATAASRGDIASVEIRTTGGRPVLKLTS